MKSRTCITILVGLLLCFLSVHAAAQDVVADALKNLQSGDPQRQLMAVIDLRTLNDPRIVPVLIAGVQDRQTGAAVRTECIKQLTERGAVQSLPTLLAVAQNPDEPFALRGPAITGLALMGRSTYADQLLTLVRGDLSIMVRKHAAEALGMIGSTDPSVVEKIRALLDDPDRSLVAMGMTALASARDVTSVPRIIEFLSSEDPGLRLNAIYALGFLRDPRAVEPLVGLINQGDDNQRVTVIAALGLLKDKRAVTPLLTLAGEVGAPESVRMRAVLSLGMMGFPEALPTISSVILNPAERLNIRSTGIGVLSNFGDAAIPTLLQALSDKGLSRGASLELSEITGVYLGTDREQWSRFCTEYLERKKQSNP